MRADTTLAEQVMRLVFEAGHPGHANRAGADAPETVLPAGAGGALHDRSMGELIRVAKRLTDAQIDEIVEFQSERGIRFGEAAVALKFASGDDVLWALSQQFHYPYAPEAIRHRNRELVVAADPFGDQAEVIRDLCSQIAMGTQQRGEPRSALSVISHDVGDGKTFLAANLAVAFSQVGRRTLLIDADMRTPRLHDAFGLESKVGLSAVLSGRNDVSAIQAVPDLPSLFVLPVGVVPPNPLELLQRSAFGLLMAELVSKFDHVIVDTPALSRSADLRVITAHCGSAIVVGRKGRSKMSALARLTEMVGRGRARVAGVVLNDH
jgi:protein-tyrosine kinase